MRRAERYRLEESHRDDDVSILEWRRAQRALEQRLVEIEVGAIAPLH